MRWAQEAGIAAGVKDDPAIAVHDLVCARVTSGGSARLEIPSLRIERGSVTMLTGPEGCGRSLLLRVLGLLTAPDAGEVLLDGEATGRLSEDARAQLRTRRCGYVFASPFLLPEFSVIENIAMPLFRVCDMEPEQARDRAEEMLDFTGLTAAATERDVSVTDQRRVALARALATLPAALFVEDLDLAEASADGFRSLLQQAAERYGVAVVASVASAGSPQAGERFLQLNAGRLAAEVAP